MRFRTEITPSPSPIPLSPDSRVVMLGSCFTDNIGTRLADSGVPVSANVCGVLYNPASIAEAVTTALDGEWSGDLEFRHDALYRNWLLSTKFAHADADTARTLWHSAFATLHKEIMCADMLIITFGTAWVFTHIASASSQYSGIVGNCHKVPAREFQRRRLSVYEITDLWRPLIARLKRHSPELRIVFTISPIRHFKDGAHGNTLSKATLHLATDMLTCLCPGTEYFPAYELLVDDLRATVLCCRHAAPLRRGSRLCLAALYGHLFHNRRPRRTSTPRRGHTRLAPPPDNRWQQPVTRHRATSCKIQTIP